MNQIPACDIIIEQLMEQADKLRIPEYEVFVVRKSAIAIAAKEGKIDQVRRNDEMGAALRIIQDGSLGFAYTSTFTPHAIKKTAAQALAAASLSDPQHELSLADPPEGAWPYVPAPDFSGIETPLEEKMERVKNMEASAMNYDKRVERVRQAEYHESEYTVRLCNSKGVDYTNSGAVYSGSLSAKATEGDDAEIGYEGDFSLAYKDLDLDEIGKNAARRATRRLGGVKVPTRTGPVLLENRVVATFIGILAGSFMADNVQRGKSKLAGKIGISVMSESVGLVDDGLHPGGIGTSPADAEGVPSQKTVLIENGVLKSYLYDIPRANIDGVKSTGNAGRGLKSPPGLTITNLIMNPGDSSLDELISQMGSGLLVTDVMGAHTADPISGDFSLGVSGVWYENGRLLHPVKGVALAGNILDMFKNVAAIGSDLRLFGSTGTPSVIIDGLTVSGL